MQAWRPAVVYEICDVCVRERGRERESVCVCVRARTHTHTNTHTHTHTHTHIGSLDTHTHTHTSEGLDTGSGLVANTFYSKRTHSIASERML